MYDKQVDNLRTNHRGVYVLHDNAYKPFARMSGLSKGGSLSGEDKEVARRVKLVRCERAASCRESSVLIFCLRSISRSLRASFVARSPTSGSHVPSPQSRWDCHRVRCGCFSRLRLLLPPSAADELLSLPSHRHFPDQDDQAWGCLIKVVVL